MMMQGVDGLLPKIEIKKIDKKTFNEMVASRPTDGYRYLDFKENYEVFVYKFLAYVMVNMYDIRYMYGTDNLINDAYQNLVNNLSYTG